MHQLCSRCKSELVEFYPEEEFLDSLKEYTVYCDECRYDLEEEKCEEMHRRGNIEGLHYECNLDF